MKTVSYLYIIRSRRLDNSRTAVVKNSTVVVGVSLGVESEKIKKKHHRNELALRSRFLFGVIIISYIILYDSQSTTRYDTRYRFILRRLQNLSYSLRPSIRQTNNNNIRTRRDFGMYKI